MSKYYTPIKAGEYDLVNISLVGFDPNTGETYEACHTAWKAALDAAIVEDDATPWWRFKERRAIAEKARALQSHFGAPPGFFG